MGLTLQAKDLQQEQGGWGGTGSKFSLTYDTGNAPEPSLQLIYLNNSFRPFLCLKKKKSEATQIFLLYFLP